MAVTDASELSARIERLEASLDATQRRLDLLARRMLDLEEKRAGDGSLPAPLDEPFAPFEEKPWSPTGRTRFFVQVAAVAFALVIALALRTLADAGVLGTTAGMSLGLAYAALLLLGGARLRHTGHVAGAVLAVCGGILPSLLVLDANVSFAVLGPIGAASVLAATVLLATAVARRLQAPALAEATTVAATVAGLAAGWPDLTYPLTAAFLCVTAAAATAIHTVRKRPWLEWPVLFATLLMWSAWSFRMHRALADPAAAGTSWPEWFAPALGVTAALHLALAIRRLRRLDAPAGVHASASPTMTVLWTAAAAASAPTLFAVWSGAAFGAGAALLALVAADVLRRGGDAAGWRAAAALVGASTAAFVATWRFAGSPVLALASWLAVTAMVTWFARVHRQLPPLLVAAAATCAVLLGAASTGTLSSAAAWPGAAVAAGIAVLAHVQHGALAGPGAALTGWARRVPTAAATCVLFAAGTGAFFALQTLTVHACPGLGDAWLPAVQSALLAAIAAVLVLAGTRWSRDHVRVGYSALVVLGAKTVVNDLWSVQGVPLVVCVLLLGMTAVAAALAARRT